MIKCLKESLTLFCLQGPISKGVIINIKKIAVLNSRFTITSLHDYFYFKYFLDGSLPPVEQPKAALEDKPKAAVEDKSKAAMADKSKAAMADKSRNKALRPGDWICPKCENHNFARWDSFFFVFY